MTSPTLALLWEIWRHHRWTVAVIAGLTVAVRFVESSPVQTLLAMFAFLLLLGVFNYTESSGDRGLGRFPRRLFTLPLTSLRLVTVPMLAGVVSIELLYLLWRGPLSRGGSTSAPFAAVLLAALVVFYLWALWALERVGTLRLIMFGVIIMGLFVVGQLPSFAPSPPPRWRSELVLAAIVSGLAAVAFLLSWRHVARARDGDDGSALRVESLFGWLAEVTATKRRAFAHPAAAHFWFEWRSSGMVLPALVVLQFLVLILPMSWRMRGDAGDTFRLLLMTLASPIGLAIPVGMAFSKSTFWSENLAVPAFLAVLPLSSEDLVAIKMRVAAASAVLSWLVMLVFVTVWLSSWGNLDNVSRLAIQVWAFHGQSIAAVYGMAVLVTIAGMFLTWRLLVSRLWSGLSGIRPLFVVSVISIPILVTAGLALDADRLPRWLLDDPARFASIAWIAAVAVIAKYWLAAYAWRAVPARYLRSYLLIWLVGTASFLALGIAVWGIMRIYLPLDVDRFLSIVILLALLAVPLARVGLAPAALSWNRHRS